MKRKNCRMSGEEKTMHERAVRIRKMTDAQLCEFIDHTYGRGMEEGTRLAKGQQPTTASGEQATRQFLAFLQDRVGSGNRIGRGTLLYLGRELEAASEAGIFEEQAQ